MWLLERLKQRQRLLLLWQQLQLLLVLQGELHQSLQQAVPPQCSSLMPHHHIGWRQQTVQVWRQSECEVLWRHQHNADEKRTHLKL